MGKKRLTTSEFIDKAVGVHGTLLFDYTLVDYINTKTKVQIICKKHNKIFEQTPNCHLQGQGCPLCKANKTGESHKYTTEIFITKSKDIHNTSKYDYSLVDYQGCLKKVKILCAEHGEFNVRPDKHLLGQGCPKCGRISLITSKRSSTESFVSRSKYKHGEKYNYSLVEYVDLRTHVEIICPLHGIFKQTPLNHLRGRGCRKCAGELSAKSQKRSTEEFIMLASSKHNNFYSYDDAKYVNEKTPVIVTCPLHGNFTPIPANHLKGSACPSCSKTGFDKNKISNLYVCEIIGNSTITGFGVTCDIRTRLMTHRRTLKQEGLSIGNTYVSEGIYGQLALDVEQIIQDKFVTSSPILNVEGFKTESTTASFEDVMLFAKQQFKETVWQC